MKEKLTLVTITHFQENPEQYGGIGPPSTEFIREMLNSVYERVPGVENCRHILIYNKPRKPTNPEQKSYFQNLQALSSEYDLEVHVQPNQGLRTACANAIRRVDSPYIFFIEHDWVFLQHIELEDILRLLYEQEDVKYVRFNKKENRLSQDHVIGEKEINELSLTKVNAFSNNPYIARTDFVSDILDIAYPEGLQSMRQLGITGFLKELIRIRLHDNPRNDDVERVVNVHYRKRIKSHGAKRGQSEFGTYMYGGIGDGPYVDHLGSYDLKSHTDSLYEIMINRFLEA